MITFQWAIVGYAVNNRQLLIRKSNSAYTNFYTCLSDLIRQVDFDFVDSFRRLSKEITVLIDNRPLLTVQLWIASETTPTCVTQ